jgi:hypothetical protein
MLYRFPSYRRRETNCSSILNWAVLQEDGEAESAAFHAQNIDQILESRTEKRLIGGYYDETMN